LLSIDFTEPYVVHAFRKVNLSRGDQSDSDMKVNDVYVSSIKRKMVRISLLRRLMVRKEMLRAKYNTLVR
jgi:hypothetical protein